MLLAIQNLNDVIDRRVKELIVSFDGEGEIIIVFHPEPGENHPSSLITGLPKNETFLKVFKDRVKNEEETP